MINIDDKKKKKKKAMSFLLLVGNLEYWTASATVSQLFIVNEPNSWL